MRHHERDLVTSTRSPERHNDRENTARGGYWPEKRVETDASHARARGPGKLPDFSGGLCSIPRKHGKKRL